jgi:uncharacterized membrane protein
MREPVADERMDSLIGTILLVGVLLSVALILAGIVWQVLASGAYFSGGALAATNLAGLLAADVRSLRPGVVDPGTLVALGIAALLATPYLRVLASVVYFALAERNWKYTLITGVVLAVLTYEVVLH